MAPPYIFVWFLWSQRGFLGVLFRLLSAEQELQELESLLHWYLPTSDDVGLTANMEWGLPGRV